VYVESGLEAIKNWIGQLVLVEPGSHGTPPPTRHRPNLPIRDSPPHKKVKKEPTSPITANLHPKATTPPRPPNPAQSFLPLFNQSATRRGLTVDYPAVFSGPPHSGRWIVGCIGKVKIDVSVHVYGVIYFT
jgi:hypothetical protein